MNPPPKKQKRTRFAPSPTGFLHLGHAYSAQKVWAFAKENRADLVLRIEDTDQTRCRDEFETAIYDDLNWLGLTWDPRIRRQTDHLEIYKDYISQLTELGLTYPCFCSRKEISDEVKKIGRVSPGPDGPIYPGTCRSLSTEEIGEHKSHGKPSVTRLDLARALKHVGHTLEFEELGSHPELKQGLTQADPNIAGDIVLARKGSPTSYHVSVVLDDHLQGITDVVRGEDLYLATHIHRLLQALWNIEPPRYHHHRILTDKSGRKLSKRDKDHSLHTMRTQGITRKAIEENIKRILAHSSTSRSDQ